MATIQFLLNGRPQTLEANPAMPLLWALRDLLGLTGTKYGCGQALCGSCTVHLDGQAIRSCATDVGQVAGRRVTTIEGLFQAAPAHPLRTAWIEHQVPQCGYCQTGMIMTAAALLAEKPKPTDADIDASLGTHVCRCGTYQRIRAAVHGAAAKGGAR